MANSVTIKLFTNQVNKYKFQIKETGTTTALPLNADDVFRVKLVDKETNELALDLISNPANAQNGSITIDTVNDKVIVTINPAGTVNLKTNRRGPSDDYKAKVDYLMYIDGMQTGADTFTIVLDVSVEKGFTPPAQSI